MGLIWKWERDLKREVLAPLEELVGLLSYREEVEGLIGDMEDEGGN